MLQYHTVCGLIQALRWLLFVQTDKAGKLPEGPVLFISYSEVPRDAKVVLADITERYIFCC